VDAEPQVVAHPDGHMHDEHGHTNQPNEQMQQGSNKRFSIHRCKREEYLKAWKMMYFFDKDAFDKNHLFDGINPSLNKKLSTETDNFCVVAYDNGIKTDDYPNGLPVGIFSFVITPNKVIGKQFVVHPKYQKQGLGKALLLECEKMLVENGFKKYYIGCSHCSAGILKSWGIQPYSSDDVHDLHKFIVQLDRSNFDELYKKFVEGNAQIEIVK
jgi:GNAT superfamily N-acetyltransferase